jgi:hypothetical protein
MEVYIHIFSAYMEVSGQLHAPAYLFPWKEHPISFGWKAGCAQELGRREKFLSSAKNQTRFLGRPACNLFPIQNQANYASLVVKYVYIFVTDISRINLASEVIWWF